MDRSRRVHRGGAVAVIVGLAMAAALLSAQDAPFALPKPTGGQAVGTSTWTIVDPLRVDPSSAAGEQRAIEVHAWYPIERSGKTPAPYLRDGIAEVRTFATALRAPAAAWDGVAAVRTHATLDAEPLPSRGRLPLLIFSHGFTASPSAYTGLLEDLASRGFIVLSIVHPYEAAAATLPDGRVVTTLDATGALRPLLASVFGEWGSEDATMAAVTKTRDVNEQRQLLQGYLAGLHDTEIALRRWVDDTRLALDTFADASAGIQGRLSAAADMDRIGVFGHSMGGVTAGEFCLGDRRCRAALNLDGIPQYGRMIDKRLDRPFLMVYSARAGRLGASDAIYRASASTYYRVDVRDTLHLEFSDMPFWAGPLRERGALGTMAPARAAEITRAIVAQYFEQELRGKRSPLLAGAATFPEVAVRK